MLQIKICGITTEDYLIKLINHNVTWAGFVFYEKSVRNVKLDQSSLFRKSKNKIGRVALFVNPKDKFLEDVITTMKPDLIQLHGSENVERCSDIRRKFGIPVMKALHIKDQSCFETVLKYENFVDKLLFDAKLTNDKLKGEKTETLNWNLMKNYKGNKEWMLAGGLNHNNILEAIKLSGANSVDISSGVENRPGIKSNLLLNKLIDKVKP
ncbi:MAG: phosphoribosylanthranilate isomerase [SAR116 cluster bacterium]|nr:phosphoribosylanthranilate isomerase [SAR116 cluster bacterium]